MPTFRRRLLLPALGLIATCALAQQSRHEVTLSTTPAEDSRPNSAAVPDAFALTGHFDRVVVLRFKYETDLLEGIERMVKQEHIHDAVILAGAGSVRNYQLHTVSNRTMPSKNMFVKDPTAPADLIGMNGYIIGGHVHAHVTLANPNGAFGGHLEPGTNVFTFAIVTIGVLDGGIDLSRADDKNYR